MNKKTNSKKINVPFGILSEIAKRSESSPQTVGATLGIYQNTTIGVSAEKRKMIKIIAAEVAREKLTDLEGFIEAVEAV